MPKLVDIVITDFLILMQSFSSRHDDAYADELESYLSQLFSASDVSVDQLIRVKEGMELHLKDEVSENQLNDLKTWIFIAEEYINKASK